jgi:iron(III) transport system permease protein
LSATAAIATRLRPAVGAWRRVFSLKTLVLLLAVGAIAYLSLVPLGFLLWETFVRDGNLSVEAFRQAYSTVGLGEMAVNSLEFAFGTTVFAVTLGTLLAYLIVRTDVPGKRLMFAASLVPLIIPGILHTIAWIFLADPRIGVLNQHIVEPVTGHAFNIQSRAGMIWVEGLHLSPLVFLLMVAAFRSMDPALEESAIMSGAPLRTVFRRITAPLVLPALYAAILIMAVRALESFEVPALLGLPNRIWVFTSRIWTVLNEKPPAFGKAGAYAMSLLVLTALGVLWQSRLSKRGRAYQTVTGKGFRPRPVQLGVWRLPAVLFIGVYFLIAVVAPLLMLAYMSTQQFYTPPTRKTLSNLSFDQYTAVFHNDLVVTALKNSLILGLGAATTVMLITAVASWIVVRTRMPGRWLVDNLAFTPLVIPGLVLGVALLFVYLRVNRDFQIGIYGSLWILFIAYLTRYMPYGMRYASTSMYQIGRELEESAQTSGASWFQAFRRVVLPLLGPGLVAGWIYIVIVSVRELSSSILLYTPGRQVLSIVIWEQYQNGQFTQLAALGMLMVGALVVLVSVAYKLGAKIGVREA